MIASGCLLLRLSSIDGEQFVGDQEYYFDVRDQQEYFDQGKYSMGSSLVPIHFNNQSIFACVTLIRFPRIVLMP